MPLVNRKETVQASEWKEKDMKEWTSKTTQEFGAGDVAQLVE